VIGEIFTDFMWWAKSVMFFSFGKAKTTDKRQKIVAIMEKDLIKKRRDTSE